MTKRLSADELLDLLLMANRELSAYENLDEINAGLLDALRLIRTEAQEGLWPEESLIYIAVTAKAALKEAIRL